MFELAFGNVVLSNVALSAILVVIAGPVMLSLVDNVFREMAGGLSIVRSSDGGLILGLFLTMMTFYGVQGYVLNYFANRVANMFVQTLFPVF